MRAAQRDMIVSSFQVVTVHEFSDRRSSAVQGEAKEEWLRLCGQAAIEQDSEKLMKLVAEMGRMLDYPVLVRMTTGPFGDC